jgi:hypothetical protein
VESGSDRTAGRTALPEPKAAFDLRVEPCAITLGMLPGSARQSEIEGRKR